MRASRLATPWLLAFSTLFVGVGVVLGLWIAPWLGLPSAGSRMGGMPMPGGSGGAMPGIAMPSQPSRGPASLTGDLSAAHADVEAGRFAQAILAYERALETDPHNLEARIHLGVSLAGVGQVERGLAELDGVLAMDADNLHALWSKAQTLFDDGRYGPSIPVWERVAALTTNTPDATAARGYVLQARQKLAGQPKRGPEKKSP